MGGSSSQRRMDPPMSPIHAFSIEDDEPMWAADRVAALTLGFAITIPKTANEFDIKAFFDRLLRKIRAFSQHENESLTDAWLRMKEMLRNCHGHNLSKGNIIKIFYHGLNEITKEALNAAAGAQMDAMTIKMDAQYKELQSHAKQPTPDLDDDEIPMSLEEEAKFMQTFHKTHFYNNYRDRDSNRDNWCSSGRNDYNRDNYRSNTDDKSYDLQR
ncbi:reverse transcriptase domain-containing protein [Tanacetum coccineum]